LMSVEVSSAEVSEGRELTELLDDLKRAPRFSIAGGLAVLARATIGIDGRLTALETRVEKGFEAVDQRFDAIDTRLDTMDARFDTMDARFDTMDTRFGLLADDVRKIGASLERLASYVIRGELKG
jgi:hypothetical protein